MIKEADVYLDDQNYDAAIVMYSRAIVLSPSDPEIYFKRGIANHRKKEYLKAVDDYTKIMEIAPDKSPVKVYALRADAYAKAGEQQMAVNDYDKAIAIAADNPNLYTDRGSAYFMMNNYDAAKKDYDKAIALDPDGVAGKIARDNRQKLEAVLEEIAKAPLPLTAEEVAALNSMEKEWAADIDKAVPFIKTKDESAARAHLKDAALVLEHMRAFLVKKRYDPLGIDRLTGMERLTEAYDNMSAIGGYMKDAETAARNFERAAVLFKETRKKLIEAELRFHEVPALRDLCRQFIAILDDFEREMRALIR